MPDRPSSGEASDGWFVSIAGARTRSASFGACRLRRGARRVRHRPRSRARASRRASRLRVHGQVLRRARPITARQAPSSRHPRTVRPPPHKGACQVNTSSRRPEIRAGDAEIVVAGGMEYMSQAPTPPASAGRTAKARHVVDSVAYDGPSARSPSGDGRATEKYEESANLAREPQRRWPRIT